MNQCLKKLVQLLDANDLELRIAAIRVVTETGFATKQTIQALGRCLREPQDDLRLAVLKALARLGARDVAPMVVPLILSTGPLRDQAMAVISSVGQSVIPQLKSLYPQADFHGKRAIVTALSRIGGKVSLAFLLKILPLESFEIQKHLALCICEALDRTSSSAQAPILKSVMRLLRQERGGNHPQILVTGAILLGHFRGTALIKRVQAELRELTDRRFPPEVRRHAILSVNRLLPDTKLKPSDYQYFFKMLCDEDWHSVAQHALQGFQRLDLPSNLMPKLIELLHKSPHFSVHIHVFERLKTSDRPEVAEAILPFLSDPRFRVREAAEAALRGMPTSIESLFGLLMKTEDLEVTQRINAILRDFPQETRQKYVERASARLLSLFDANDPHYKSFLEFVKSLDPEPLRKRIYQKVHALKRGRTRDKWERIAALVQLLWDNHLITAEGRYLLATALVRLSPKDLAPASRRANLGLRVLRALIYDDYEDLSKRLVVDKDLTAEDFYYLGFHFSEEGEDLRPFARAMLEHVVKTFPRSSVAGPAAHKLRLQTQAAEASAKAAAESSAKERGRGKPTAAQEPPPAGAPAVPPRPAVPAAGTSAEKGRKPKVAARAARRAAPEKKGPKTKAVFQKRKVRRIEPSRGRKPKGRTAVRRRAPARKVGSGRRLSRKGHRGK